MVNGLIWSEKGEYQIWIPTQLWRTYTLLTGFGFFRYDKLVVFRRITHRLHVIKTYSEESDFKAVTMRPRSFRCVCIVQVRFSVF